MLLKPCPHCGKLMPYGNTYCDTCAPIIKEQIEERKREWNKRNAKKYNARRDPEHVSFYNSSKWKRLRNTVMRDNGYRCKDCGAMAGQIIDGVPTTLEVHHIIPLQTKEGWPLRFDYGNLECLCLNCHNKRHGRFHKSSRTRSDTV